MKTKTSAAILALVAAGLIPLISGCEHPPTTSLQTAKLAIQSASHAGATRYAKPDYRAAEMLVTSGWVEIGRQNGRLAPFRNYAVAESVLSQATRMANRAALVAQERSRSVESLAHSEYASLERELSSYRQALDGTLAAYREQRYWSRGSLSLQTANRLIGRGEFDDARNEIKHGREALKQLANVISVRTATEAPLLGVWRHWVNDAVAGSRASGGSAIVVVKADHTLYVLRAGRMVESYRCDLSYNSAEQKIGAGDYATPEGQYRIIAVKTRSRYYKALEINYPNAEDRARFEEAKRRGDLRRTARIGGLIEIHGEGGNGRDWTMGCVALANRDMDRLWRYVSVGMPVTIVRRIENWP